jgi:flagellar basal body-associated protein FliL
VDQSFKNKELFEDDTIEDELSKLEAEIEEASDSDDMIDLTNHQKGIDKKSETIELDREEFLTEKEDNKEAEAPETDRAKPKADHPASSITPWYLNKNIIGISTITLIIISLVIYISRGELLEPDTGKLKEQYPAIYGSVRERIGPKVLLPNPPLALSPFIIPIESETDDAYLFFRISVMSPNSMVYEEIKRKKAFLRGDLYELLKKMVSSSKVSIAPREEIKKALLRALNKRLKSGKIEKIYFTDFLLV